MHEYGDLTVMRNGRSTSQVSIYNYPEHLNPFYEEDNHKRLRFWEIDSRDTCKPRRNSFSIVGLKDIWSFRSFRLKKKSSTLGINKTSESPPLLRRNMGCTQVASATSSNDNIHKCARHRSSLQAISNSQSAEQNFNGLGFIRKDQTRSSTQTVGLSSNTQQTMTMPSSRRECMVRGRYSTLQPMRDNEFNESYSVGIISRGPSQISVHSNNPFDTDIVDEITIEHPIRTANNPMKVQRKKRRAPPVPVGIKVLKSGRDICQKDSQNANNLNILSLAAEIENFVNTSGDPDCYEKNKPSILNLEGTTTDEIIYKTNDKVVQYETNMQEVESKPTNLQSHILETDVSVGHVECIHVNLETSGSFRNENGPSRTTSFKKNVSSSYPLTSNLKHKVIDGLKVAAKIETNNLNMNEHISVVQPPIPTKKPTDEIIFEAHVPESRNITMNVISDLLKTENNANSCDLDKIETSKSSSKDLSNDLKIVEAEEIILNSNKTPYMSVKNLKAIPFMEIGCNVENPHINDNLYRVKPASQINWINSTLAPLEPNIAIEKRKSVKDIIKSINRSQQLLNAAVHKRHTQNYLRNNLSQPDEDMNHGNDLPSLDTKIAINEPNYNLNQNLRTLDESQLEMKRIFQEIAVMGNLPKQKTAHEGESNLYGVPDENSPGIDNTDSSPKMDNNEIFIKSKVNKEMCAYRESSPTSSNLDWNPVPKPKRSLNIPSPDLNKRFDER